jgi:hypothetical protein
MKRSLGFVLYMEKIVHLKNKMKIEIPEFEVFPESNISGRMIVNPYWLEHLLNLFFQGYLGEVWEEIIDTEMNHCALIKNLGYGIIGQEFNKKHLDLSNSSPPVQTSNSTSLTSAKQKGFNKDLTATQQVATPKCPSDTSLNPDIQRLHPNFIFYSRNMEQLNNRR